MSKPRFQIVIEAQPQADDPDGNRRVRMALKSMLRRHGLRCVTVVPVAEPEPTATRITRLLADCDRLRLGSEIDAAGKVQQRTANPRASDRQSVVKRDETA